MILGLLQARMESTRLPGKVLLKINKKSIIWHILNRVKFSKKIDKTIVIIPNNKKNNILYDYLKKNNFNVFRGSSKNVLDRYYKAAKKNNAKIIVRLTGDDPFKDPRIIDIAINKFLKEKLDYISNCSYDNSIKSSYPEGIDVEVFSMKCLEKVWKSASKNSEKEHVTPYIFNNKSKFKIKGFYSRKNYSKHRWTLDYKEDYIFAKKIYKHLYKDNKIFYMKDILSLLNKYPNIQNINNKFIRYEGYFKSKFEDK